MAHEWLVEGDKSVYDLFDDKKFKKLELENIFAYCLCYNKEPEPELTEDDKNRIKQFVTAQNSV